MEAGLTFMEAKWKFETTKPLPTAIQAKFYRYKCTFDLYWRSLI
jgi:hypothetical protein